MTESIDSLRVARKAEIQVTLFLYNLNFSD